MKAFLTTTLLVLSCVCTGEAATRLGNLTLLPLSNPAGQRSHGYVEHRLRITNDSARKPYSVRVAVPANSYGSNGDSLNRIERTVMIAPGMSVNVNLPAPALQIRGTHAARIYANGVDIGTINIPSLNNSYYGNNNKVTILTSRSINGQSLDDAIEKALFPESKTKTTSKRSGSSRTRSRHNRDWNIVRSELELPEWSENWLAYSCYDAVILHADDLGNLSSPLRNALHEYTRAGGSLIIAGAQQWPFDWEHTPDNQPNSPAMHIVGFGQVALYKTGDLTTLQSSGMNALLSIAKETLLPWGRRVNMGQANKHFPIIDNMSIPTRSLFLIMLIFAILFGPVLLSVLAKYNRRIWLLWLAPSISLVSCVVITAYALLSEGITPSVRMEGITLLNEQNRTAVTLGMLGLYCPLTPAGGLHFNTQTELSPYVAARHNSGSAKSIKWTRDQHFWRGWVSARVPTYLQIRKCEVRRERLEITSHDGTLSALNGLGAEIEKLWLRNPEGKWLTLETPLPSGAQQALIPVATPPKHKSFKPRTFRNIYKGQNWPEEFKKLEAAPIALQPNTYLAQLKGAPFLEHGLKGNVHERSRSYVIGTLPSDAWQNNGGRD
jgi:hypothetical protein